MFLHTRDVQTSEKDLSRSLEIVHEHFLKQLFVLVLVLWLFEHFEYYAFVNFKVLASVNICLEALRLFILVLGDPVGTWRSFLRLELLLDRIINIFHFIVRL